MIITNIFAKIRNKNSRLSTTKKNIQNPELRIRNIYLESRILIFIHPGSKSQREGGKISCLIFFVTTNFTK
jgi:hypothetical protein